MNSKKSQSPFVYFPKIASRVALAVTFLLTSSSGLTVTLAANEKPIFTESSLPELANPSDLLAQATGNSILYFYTPNHIVHVYRQGNNVSMNVFDSRNNVTRLSGANAAPSVLNNFPSYISFGSFSGAQATYIVSITGDRQARLLIQNASGQTIVDESASRFDAFNPPPNLGGGGTGTPQGNILAFQTSTYAVRVFQDGNSRKMNVHNRLTNITEVNGAAASLAPAQEPFENAVSYVASANNINGAFRYFARLTRNGGILEIQDVNSQVRKQENSTGDITINIPTSDLPAGFEGTATVRSMWVAAVFGDESTLAQLRELGYANAVFDSARQGRFINVGAFEDRDDANDLVDDLRDDGFNSRVLFRDVHYR